MDKYIDEAHILAQKKYNYDKGLKIIMLKAENIKITNNVITCHIIGEDVEQDFAVCINDWKHFICTDKYNELDAIHVRNKLKSLYIEKHGKLPNEISLIFG